MCKTKTPCVGICSTVFGDIVCRGCKRFAHEVIDWNQYQEDQKQAVIARLDNLMHQVMVPKIAIVDRAKFDIALRQVEIEQGDEAGTVSTSSLIFAMLKKSAKQITSLDEHGLQVLSPFQNYSAFELREIIDQEMFVLSSAIFDTNFNRSYARFEVGTDLEREKAYAEMNVEVPVEIRPMEELATG